MNWITEQIKREIKAYYAVTYGVDINDDEVIEIAINLSNFVELLTGGTKK